MPELTVMEGLERVVRRQQKLPPAGTKRKIPDSELPPLRVTLSSLVDSPSGRRQLFAQLSRTAIASTAEVMRQADEYLARQQAAKEHLDMEQG